MYEPHGRYTCAPIRFRLDFVGWGGSALRKLSNDVEVLWSSPVRPLYRFRVFRAVSRVKSRHHELTGSPSGGARRN